MHVLSTPPAFVLSQDQTLRECFPVIGITTRERNDQVGIRPVVHSVLAVVAHRSGKGVGRTFQRNHQPAEAGRGINISGVDFWHAVEFSRNGRFLRSRFTGALRALPFVLAFPTLSDSFVSDSRSKRDPADSLSSSSLSRFPFRRVRLYQILSGLIPSQRALPSGPLGRSDE